MQAFQGARLSRSLRMAIPRLCSLLRSTRCPLVLQPRSSVRLLAHIASAVYRDRWKRIMSDTAAVAPAASAAEPAPNAISTVGADRKHVLTDAAGDEPQPKKKKQRHKGKVKPVKEGSTEEVLEMDIKNLLARVPSAAEEGEGEAELPTQFSALDVEITELASTGDGLALHGGRVYVVPFTVPGDVVTCKIIRHSATHTATDFVRVVQPGPDRDDSLIGCRYFATCGGCQLQMLPYAAQLAHKRRVVQKAFQNFFTLSQSLLPEVEETIGSPLQYNYRTKLTPHFDGPRRGGFKVGTPPPPIGFQVKGRRQVLDIEDCPIGTPAVRAGIAAARKHVHENLYSYKKGATQLLRESTTRIPRDPSTTATATESDVLLPYTEEKTCITDNNATSVEYVGDTKFSNPAGAFFQNNNAILPTFTAYIRDALSLPVPGGGGGDGGEPMQPRFLVDAYCGSGLFSITLGKTLSRVTGVDISSSSIKFATHNAAANNLSNATFLAGNAERIFDGIDFPPDETSVIIDPPRKGCDNVFLDQLMRYGPRRVVYVSCNVHTQARDLAYLLGKEVGRWKVERIRGFDFFPQTGHVESVAVIARVD